MNQPNIEIRIEMVKYNLKQWEVARLLNMSESVFSRRFRKEIPEDEKQRILAIIREYNHDK